MMAIEELKALTEGQWIFTCDMKPKQFKAFDAEKNPADYNRASFTDETWELFSKYNHFTTLEGNSHSVKNCTCKPVSENYALWFIKNKCWELFPKNQDICNWDEYEAAVKALCIKDGIEYEGI